VTVIHFPLTACFNQTLSLRYAEAPSPTLFQNLPIHSQSLGQAQPFFAEGLGEDILDYEKSIKSEIRY